MAHESFTKPTPAYAQATGETDSARATPAAAFESARATFRRGEHLDMAALAAEMGVARTTLYRWTGDRERLLSDVIWADMSALLTRIAEHTEARGAERISQIADEYFTLLSKGGMQAFLTAEGDTGLRLVMALDGGVRPRLVELIANLIAREASEGHYTPPEDPRLLADVIIALGERFLHHGGDPKMNPDLETARRAIALLVRENPHTT